MAQGRSVAINGPYPEEWGNYLTQMAGALEETPGVLYSVKPYVSGVTRDLTFFDFVQGNREDLTNMTDINKMPNPESFLAQYLRVFNWGNLQSADSGEADDTAVVSQANDWIELTKRGILNLKIGRKTYGPWPLWMLPSNSMAQGFMASGSDLAVNYAQTGGVLYPLVPHLMFATMQPFYVTLSWPGGPVTLSTGAESELPIEVMFDGKTARAVQ